MDQRGELNVGKCQLFAKRGSNRGRQEGHSLGVKGPCQFMEKKEGHLMPKPSGYTLQVQHLMLSDFSSVCKYKNDR